MQIFLVDGVQTQSISILDRGLAYGDGIFETIAVNNQQLDLWDLHCRRIASSCEALNIPFDAYDTLQQEAQDCASNIHDGIVKIIITAGDSERGYSRPAKVVPRRIISAYTLDADKYNEAYQQGIVATICTTRLASHQTLTGIKHLNRLEQVMARNEWNDEYIEGIMLDTDGYVREGTMTNLFIMQGMHLLTPALDQCGVRGVQREHIIMRCQKAGILVEEIDWKLDEVLQSDSLFICNSMVKILPVKTINQHSFDVEKVHHLVKELDTQ